MKQLIIYRVFHKETGKCYIGKCSKGLERVNSHFKSFSNPKLEYRARLLYRAMNKYGSNLFGYEILYVATNEIELNEKEKEFIILFDSRNNEKGYNIAPGGTGGNMWEGITPEERAIRIEKQITNQVKSYSIERKAKLSENMKKMRADKEKSKKNRDIHSERMKIYNKNPNVKRHCTPVLCVENNQIFKSIKKLSLHLNMNIQIVQYYLTKIDPIIKGLHYKKLR